MQGIGQKQINTKLINNSRGETIAETLISVLILSLTMAIIAGAVATSSNINNKAKSMLTASDLGTAGGTISTEERTVQIYNCTVTRKPVSGQSLILDNEVNEDILSVTTGAMAGRAQVTLTVEQHAAGQGGGDREGFYYYSMSR